ncbi:MAG TPA: SBBP repeat-containing protein, partial [Nitrospiria bacterium]|nr:SBBP repeat-containing protein [Nitrospiria bacterium]
MKKYPVVATVFAVGSLVLTLQPAKSQAYNNMDDDWDSHYSYDGSENSAAVDSAGHVAVDDNGNVYVTGASDGSGSGKDYATLKYDPNGNQLWVARYNGPGNDDDVANGIAVDGAGNVYVTGYSTGSGGANYDYATIKYDSNGNQLWVARYNGPGNDDDVANGIAVDGAGNVYVTGYSRGSGSGYDYATIKYDSNGNQLWSARYNGPGNSKDVANGLVLDSAGNVYVTGGSIGSGTGEDYATIKYNSSGTQVWAARYNGPGNNDDVANVIVIDSTGNLYVTGSSIGSGTGEDYATIKYNSSGTQVWAARYNGPGNDDDVGNALDVDDSGNVYVAGYSKGSNTHYDDHYHGSVNDYDYATIKYDSNGNQSWVSRYDGPGNGDDIANGVAVDDDGNVYVTGSSLGSGTGEDIATVKYDSDGNESSEDRHNGTGDGDDWGNSITKDHHGHVYVTGVSHDSDHGDKDYCTIKYSNKADLSITKTDSPDPVLTGNNLTYSIVVTNLGPDKATGVTMTDPLPGGVTLVSATSTQVSCTGIATVTCSIGTLNNGAGATVTIVVTPTTAGVITNTAMVSGNQTDPHTANNSASASTTVNSHTFTLTITTAGTGSGTVSGAGTYNYNQTATVSATANTGSSFAGWTGPNAAECATGSVVMTANKSCTANFTLNTYTLTLTTAGSGSGTVSGAGTYNYNQTATVSATANTGSSFAGWTGPDAAECATGSVVMTANKSCTANFSLINYTLTLTTAGSGSGTVSGAGTYNYNQTATVSATANTGSTFTGWTGPNAAECATGSVVMTANKSCTANFSLITFNLTLTTAGSGSGTVSGAGTYIYGQIVT